MQIIKLISNPEQKFVTVPKIEGKMKNMADKILTFLVE